jgi:hypothetical protein
MELRITDGLLVLAALHVGFLTVIIHESGHWIAARLLGRGARMGFTRRHPSVAPTGAPLPCSDSPKAKGSLPLASCVALAPLRRRCGEESRLSPPAPAQNAQVCNFSDPNTELFRAVYRISR